MHIRTIWSLVKTADWVSLLVLSALVASYFLCFCIMVYKCIALVHESAKMKQLLKKIGNSWRLQDFIALQKVQGFGDSIAQSIVQDGLHQVQCLLLRTKKEGVSSDLGERDIICLEQVLNQSIDNGLARARFGLPILSTCAAAAPLAGLFGTIWGLMHSFVNIGLERSADLAVIAPGIAEALLTTLMGLIVAIPALISYHYLAQKIATFEKQIVSLAERFISCARYVQDVAPAQDSALRDRDESRGSTSRQV